MAQRDPRSEGAFRGQSQPAAAPLGSRGGRRAPTPAAINHPSASIAPITDFLGLDAEIKSRVSGAYTQSVRPSVPAPTPAPVFAPAAPTQTVRSAAQFPAPPAQPAAPVHEPSSFAALMQPTASALNAPPSPAPAHANSWLLELDDARAGRAGLEPVIADPTRSRLRAPRPAPLDASFAEAPPVAQRTMPWILGGLIACAAGSFLFVVAHTLLSPKRDEPRVTEAPLAPVTPAAQSGAELADPGKSRSNAARTSGRPAVAQRPKTANPPRNFASDNSLDPNAIAAPPAARPAQPRVRTEAPPTFIEIPPPDFAPPEFAPMVPRRAFPDAGQRGNAVAPDAPRAPESALDGTSTTPALAPSNAQLRAPEFTESAASNAALWWPGALHGTPLATSELGPGSDEIALSPERRERVARWLMQHSRSASPLDDAQAELVVPPARVTLDDAATVASTQPESAQPAAPPNAPAPSIVLASVGSSAPPRAAVESNTTVASAPSAVWEGATVPVDQIASEVRILTPKVGRVRAVLDNGEAQEGRLFAVGQGQVWIDCDLGRLAFARARLERLEQIGATPAEAPAVDAPRTDARNAPLELAPRVRVRTPGGLFYGRVVSREGTSVVLLTDEGARVTIEGGEIELAPARRTVVRHDPAPAPKKAAPAPAPAPAPEYDPDNPHGLH